MRSVARRSTPRASAMSWPCPNSSIILTLAIVAGEVGALAGARVGSFVEISAEVRLPGCERLGVRGRERGDRGRRRQVTDLVCNRPPARRRGQPPLIRADTGGQRVQVVTLG